MQSAPPSSVLKLSVAAGGEKYFSAAPGFQARLDNFRIAPPVKTPINIGDDGSASSSNTNMMAAEGGRTGFSGDYYTLGQGAYKLNPM